MSSGAAAKPAGAPDAAERRRALEVTRSFIVQAPAGSGKTELLVQRYLALLATVERPESVVALTFTRKAAAEMRGRVLRALEAARQPPLLAAHARATWELAAAALRQDEARGWELLANPARLRLVTLDALCLTLVARMPWVARWGAAPRPAEEAGPLYRAAAAAAIARVDAVSGPHAAAMQALARHCDGDLARAQDLLADMLEHRGQWLPRLLGEGEDDAMRRRMEAELEAIVRRGLSAARAGLQASGVAHQIVDLARAAAAQLNGDRIDSEVVGCLDLEELPPAEAASLPQWRGLARCLLTNSGTVRQKLGKLDGYGPGDGDRKAQFNAVRAQIRDEAAAALHAVRELPPGAIGGEQWAAIRDFSAALRLAAAELRVGFAEGGAVDFTEVGLAAAQALGSPAAPTGLAFALDGELRHLLVDEFQDTSQAQIDLLLGLTAEWREGDGRTLFLVGDPMQSIYGFRNAVVGLYLRARAEGLGGLRPEGVTLRANFRSHAGLVEWCNRHFGAAFPRVEDAEAGAVAHAPAVAARAAEEGMAARVQLFEPAPGRAAEARAVADAVEAAPPGESVAILVAGRRHLGAILPELRRRGLGYRAVKFDSLAQSPQVRDLLALTRALYHRGDRVAWLALLRAPWCGLRLADLEALCGEDADAAVWDLLHDGAAMARLTGDGRARAAWLAGGLAEAVAAARRRAPRAVVEACWRGLGGGAAPGSDAAAYLALLERMSQAGDPGDLDRLEAAVAKLYAEPDSRPQPVQIMTVHNAKGLEFDHVIVPGLDRYTKGGERRLLAWSERPFLLAPRPETGGADALYDYLQRQAAEKSGHEQLRLLYVAATRARRRLYLMGQARADKTPDKRSLLARIWGALGNVEIAAAPETAAEAAVPALPRLRRVAAVAPPVEATVSAARAGVYQRPLAGALQRQVGTAVHALLRQMAGRVPLGWDKPRLEAQLRAAGCGPRAWAEAFRRAARALDHTVADARGQWILARHEEARDEYALTGMAEGELRRAVIDRTFVEGGVRWVIDYKTAVHEGGGRAGFLDRQEEMYRGQLNFYAGLLGEEGRHLIRCGLYFPMLGAWREWGAAL